MVEWRRGENASLVNNRDKERECNGAAERNQRAMASGSLAVKIRWLGAHLLGPGWTRNAHQPHATWLTYLPLASCSKKTGSRAACVYMQKYLSHCL